MLADRYLDKLRKQATVVTNDVFDERTAQLICGGAGFDAYAQLLIDRRRPSDSDREPG
jgi:hypothetical protein